jgi:O-phosphoseryl-tRNA(Sec) selenium transferase, SepSecS
VYGYDHVTGVEVVSVRRNKPTTNNKANKTVVLWSRIDQKSCFKAITSAGLTCVVVPTKLDGDAVITDMDAMVVAIQQHQGKGLGHYHSDIMFRTTSTRSSR